MGDSATAYTRAMWLHQADGSAVLRWSKMPFPTHVEAAVGGWLRCVSSRLAWTSSHSGSLSREQAPMHEHFSSSYLRHVH